MANDDFLAWLKYHTLMFGMNDADISMVASWRNALDMYSLAELKAASVELLRLAPTYRNEHVSGLFRILGVKRAQQTKAFAAQRDDELTGLRCSLCQNSGYVLVPHPQCVKDGEFIQGPGGYKATAAVTCSCYKGNQKQQSFDNAKVRPMSLQAYETSVTKGWPDMIADKNHEDKGRAELQNQARLADNARGKLKIAK